MMERMEPRRSDVWAGVERSVDGVFLEASDGRLLYANPAACHLFGGGPEELTEAWDNGMAFADRSLWDPMLEHRRRTGWLRGIAPLRRLDGTVYWAGVSSTTFVAGDGEELGFWIVRDVTPRVQQTRRLEAYDQIAEALLAGSEIPEVLDLVTSHACAIFDATFAAVVTPNPNGLGVMIAAAAGSGPAGELVGRSYPPGGLSQSVMASVTPRLIEDITATTRTSEIRDLGLKAGMIVPIVSAEEPVGTLFIANGRRHPKYTPDDLDEAASYARRAGVALALGAARSAAEHAKDELAEQLQHALESRVIIEQAKGVIAGVRSISTEEAFHRLRTYARSHNIEVHAVARQVVDRHLII